MSAGPAGQDDFSFVGGQSLKRKQTTFNSQKPSAVASEKDSAFSSTIDAAQRPCAAPDPAPTAPQREAVKNPSTGPSGSAAQRTHAPSNPVHAVTQRWPVNSGNAAQNGCAADQNNQNAIVVGRRQTDNPLLLHIRNVRWQFGDISPDYQMGPTSCALFLSLRFHLLKPEYIHHRIKKLQRSFRLRIILCHVDVDDVVEPLSEVARAALLNDCTLFCAFSIQECARYLESFKSFEAKPADAIQGRVEEDYLSRLNAAMTTIRGVNRTNVLTLGRTFKTAAGMMQASMEELSACPGIGPTKVRRLYETFHEPFRRSLQPPVAHSQLQETRQQQQQQQQQPSLPQGGSEGEERPSIREEPARAVINDGIADIGDVDADTEEAEEHAGAFTFL